MQGLIEFILFYFYSSPFFSYFHDILKDMFNHIVIFCILFSLLIVCKIASQLHELISWKRKTEKEQQKKQQDYIQWENNTLYILMNLTKEEIARMRYLMKQHSHTAYFPSDDIDILNLNRKGCIKIIREAHKQLDKIISTSQSEKGLAFYVPEDILSLINKHHDKIIRIWKKVPIKTIFDLFQNEF